MTTTIRRNSFKKIEAILSAAVLIREFKYDDMGDTNGTATVEKVLTAGKEMEFDRVVDNGDGTVRFSIHQNWSFTAYATVDAARKTLTPFAFSKYLPTN